jgi:integrase
MGMQSARAKRRIVPLESEEQQALFQWVRLVEGRYPELRLLYHIPNERQCSPAQGARLKKQGVRRGIPDICLPVARHGFHSLYIELKRLAGGGVSPEQAEWIDELHRHGNKAIVCRGWMAAKEAIEEYLRQPDAMPFED